jgi:hypothetical protein
MKELASVKIISVIWLSILARFGNRWYRSLIKD